VKASLEIVWCPDNSTFLNFWDSKHCHDICCQIGTGGRLIDDNGAGKEITLAEFLTQVKNVMTEED